MGCVTLWRRRWGRLWIGFSMVRISWLSLEILSEIMRSLRGLRVIVMVISVDGKGDGEGWTSQLYTKYPPKGQAHKMCLSRIKYT